MYYCYLEKLCPIRQRWTLREVAVDAVDGVLYYSSTVKPRRQNNNKKMKKQKKMNVEAATSTPPLMLRREKEQRRNDAPMDDVESSSPTAATSTQAAHLPRSNYDDDDDVDGDVSASLPLPPTTAHRTCWKKQLRVLNLTYAADRYAIHPGSEGFRESSLLTFCVEGSEETWKASSSSPRANHKSSDHVVLGNDPLVGGSDGGGPTSLVAVHQATSPTNINARTLDPVLSTANSASLPHERGAALSEPPPRRRPSHGIISWLRRAFTPGSDASPLHHHHSRGVLATPPRVHPHQQPVDRLSFEELESFGSRMPNEAAENVLNHQLSSEARSVSSMSRHVHTHAAGTRTTSLSSFPPSNSASGVHAAGPDTMMTMGSGVQASSPPQEVAKEVEEDEPVVLLITFRALNYDAFRLITLRLRESLVRRGLSPPLHRGLPPLDPRNGLQLATVPLHLRWSLRRLNDVLMYSFLRAHVVQVPPHTREVRATCGNLILTPDAAMLVMEDGQCPRWMPWSYLRHIDYALHGSESFVAFRSTTSSSSSSSSTATNSKKMMMVPDFVCIPLYPIYPALTDFEPEEATARVVDVVRRIVASGVANHNNNHNNNHMCDDAPEAATTTTKSVPTRNVSAQYADVFAYIAAMGDGLRWPAARRQARDPPPPPFVLKAVLASSLGIAELNHAHSAAPTPRKPRRERSGAEAMAALHGGLVIGDLIPRAEPTPIHGVALVGSTSPTSYPTPMNCVVGDEPRS